MRSATDDDDDDDDARRRKRRRRRRREAEPSGPKTRDGHDPRGSCPSRAVSGSQGRDHHHRRPTRFDTLMTGPAATDAAPLVATTVGACGRLKAIIIASGRSRSLLPLLFWLARSLIELCTDVSVEVSWSFFE